MVSVALDTCSSSFLQGAGFTPAKLRGLLQTLEGKAENLGSIGSSPKTWVFFSLSFHTAVVVIST